MKKIIRDSAKLVCIFILLIGMLDYSFIQSMKANETITRAQWISDLVYRFSMQINDFDFLESIYSDVDDEDSYYLDVMTATEFGIVDIDPGSEFYPNDALTRDFAAYTLNQCLCFQLDEDNSVFFDDQDEIKHLVEAQVAVQQGWFHLEDDRFLPNKEVTIDEYDIMVAEIDDMLSFAEIESDYQNTYEFKDEIYVVEKKEDYIFEGSELQLLNCEDTIAVDDVIVLYESDFPMGYKVQSVYREEQSLIMDVISVNIDEYITLADAQGSIETNLAYAQPAEGTDLVFIEGGTETLNYEDGNSIPFTKVSGTKKINALKAYIGFEYNGTIVNYECTISNIVLDYKFDVRLLKQNVYFDVSGNFDASINFGQELLDKEWFPNNNGKPLKVPICTIPSGGVGTISLFAFINVDGKISVGYDTDFNVGIHYSNTKGLRFVKSFQKNDYYMNVAGNAKIGAEIRIGIEELPLFKGYVYGQIGAEAEAYVESRVIEDVTCINISAWAFANLGITAEIKVAYLNWKKTKEWQVWNENNSPIKLGFHLENGKLVEECTYGKGGYKDKDYYSNNNDKNGGTCLDTSNQIQDSTGNVISLYEYNEIYGEETIEITGYNGRASTLIIPSHIDGYEVKGISANAFANLDFLERVITPASLKYIGPGAFANCQNLVSIQLTEKLLVLNNAFNGCDNLKALRIPKKLLYLSVGLFRNDIERIITYLDGTSIKKMNLSSYPFTSEVSACGNIGDDSYWISFEDEVLMFTGNGVVGENISAEAFYDSFPYTYFKYDSIYFDKNIKGINMDAIGAFAIDGIELINGIDLINSPCASRFIVHEDNKCLFTDGATLYNYEKTHMYRMLPLSKVKSFTIPSSVQTIDKSCFSECEYLENVIFNNKISLVTDYMFYCCERLKTCILNNKITEIGAFAFANCTALENVEFGKSLKEIEVCAFSDCRSLKKLHFPEGLEAIWAYNFRLCENLEEVIIPKSIRVIQTDNFECLKDTVFTVYSNTYGYDYAKQNHLNVTVLSSISDVGIDDLYFDTAGNYLRVIWNHPTTLEGYLDSRIDGFLVYRYDKETKKWNKIGQTDQYDTIFYDSEYEVLDVNKYAVKGFQKCDNKYYYTSTIKGEYIAGADYGFNPTYSATTSTISLKWKKIDNAEGYHIYLYKKNEGYKKIANTKKNQYQLNDLNNTTFYNIRIEAYRTIDGKKYVTFDFCYAATKPKKVANLKASSSSNVIKLSWSHSKDAADCISKKYDVYRYSQSQKKWNKLATTSKNTYTDKNRKSNTTYRYAIRSIYIFDFYSIEVPSKSSFHYIDAKTKYDIPVISISKKTSTTVKVKWSSIKDIDYYQVYRSTKKGGTYKKIITTKSTYYNSGVLKKGKTYYYKVRGYEIKSNKKVYTAFSQVKSYACQ